MKNKISLLFITLAVSFSVTTCSSEKSGTDEEEIEKTMRKNIESLENEDIDMLIETTSEKSPMYSNTVVIAERLFEQYDLHYELENFKIDKIEGYEAQVSFVQITTKINGPQFRNNRLFGVHTLKKEDGTWKFYDTKILNIDYL